MKTALEKIQDAIEANGGEEFRKDWCLCVPDVGHVDCEYCAIHYGLKAAKTAVAELLDAHETFGVLACTPEWQAKKSDAVARAKGQAVLR